MRFERLHIPAFGPFTDLALSFPAEGPDLHVVYGANEAGKSSLLRAMRDLLFGIHAQSPDNFLHDYKNLRLSAEIESLSGTRLTFQRRKGNKNTLLDGSGNPLADSALLPFLGSVDRSYFSAMFGLGSGELRDGARELLRGEGEIGSALFSASLGGTPVQRVLDALVAESEQLFKGRATANVSIRPAVGRYKELLKQSREAMASADAWEGLSRELEQQEAMKSRLEDEIAEGERGIAWIQRCEDALPSIGRLNEETRLLGELPALPDVAGDFVARAQAARAAARESGVQVQNVSAQVGPLEARLKACDPSPEVIAEAAALEILRQDLGAYRKGKETLAGLKSRLAGIEPALRAGMENLEVRGDLESLETLRLGSAVRMRCEEAAKAFGEATRKLAEGRNKAEELEQAIASQRRELDSLPETDLAPLREALAVAAGATEADKTLEASAAGVGTLLRQVATARARIPEVPEDLEAAAHLPVPALNTIRVFRERFSKLKSDSEAAAGRIREEKTAVSNLEEELGRLERKGALPTEDSLGDARNHRDHGWQLVLADWKGPGTTEELDAGLPLEEAFPQAVARADEIADQLRRHAEAVAQADEKRLQIQAARRKIDQEEEAVAESEVSGRNVQASWEEAWAASGVRPRSPEEMEDWRENWVRLVDAINKLRDAEAALESKRALTAQAREALAAALEDSAEKPFSVLWEAARRRVQQEEQAAGRRETLKEQFEARKQERESVRLAASRLAQEVETARTNWESQSRAVGLPEVISPEAGLALLLERKELLARFDTWRQWTGEAREVEDALLDYARRVREMAASLALEAAGTEAQEAGLWKALGDAREIQARYDQLVSQLQDGKRELEAAKQRDALARRGLEEVLEVAGLGGVEELEPLLAHLEQRAALRGRVDNLREILGGLARSQGVDEFIAGVLRENADELPMRRAAAGSMTAERKATLQEVQATLAELIRRRAELEKAGDAAADFRQQAEAEAAKLREDASRFVRLRWASHFLRIQIEQFRERNQGPLLERSGQVFKAITQGAFEGLSAEFTDQDVPVMVGRRADDSTVPVEGMSEGTRDQLYLALRLAALERHLETHEPMPLILDDLLVTFDNERTRAILPQLSALAGRTQILLFTHHEHLVELVRETLGNDNFTLHRLQSKKPTHP